MAEYRVNLDIFAGPLDLLLYLVRKEEVDIYDIPIARITEQYLQYIEILKQLDIDLAGDFLVMAATLMEIKSAMLLPQAEPEEDADEQSDPRAELVRQLLEYKKFKDAANLLDATATEHNRRHPRPDAILSKIEPPSEPQRDLEQVSIWDLLDAFDALMKATGRAHTFDHITDDTPIDLYQIEILHHLQNEGPLPFHKLFGPDKNRAVLIGLFLALLELIREKLIWADQHEHDATIYLRALTDQPPEQAVRNAIVESAEEKQSRIPDHPAQSTPIPIRTLPAETNRPGAGAPETHTSESRRSSQ